MNDLDGVGGLLSGLDDWVGVISLTVCCGDPSFVPDLR